MHKRYLHIEYSLGGEFIWYKFTDECMRFNLLCELEDADNSWFDDIGLCFGFMVGNVSIDLDLFLKQTYNPTHDLLLSFIKQANTIENRYKRIKKILE